MLEGVGDQSTGMKLWRKTTSSQQARCLGEEQRSSNRCSRVVKDASPAVLG